MTKSKDTNLFDENIAYSEILDVDASRVRRKIRGNADTVDRTSLLTSTDLFGDIIDDFRSVESVPASMKESAPATPSKRKAPAEDKRPLGAMEAAAELLIADTAPFPRPPREDGSSLLDAGYSTVLKNKKLPKDVVRFEQLHDPTGDEGSDYGEYVLLDPIATGGMAEVFRAKRKGVEGFEKIVALKRILPHLANNVDFVEMFIAEAKLAASLTHPNIAQIFDLGKIETSYYIAMEFVEGRDLRTVLSRAVDRETPAL